MRLKPEDEQNTEERMRLNVLWAQYLFCLKCGTKWTLHDAEAGGCANTSPLQLVEVEKGFGAVPGRED